jgi:hypothetical protein
MLPEGALYTTFDYYSPYFPICQCSGSGKTRLLLETGRQLFPIVYVSLGSPLKSPNNVCKFFKGLECNLNDAEIMLSVQSCKSFLASIFSFVLNDFNEFCTQNDFDDKSKLIPSFLEHLMDTFQPKHDNAIPLTAVWDRILKDHEELDKQLPQIFSNYVKPNLSLSAVWEKILKDNEEIIKHFAVFNEYSYFSSRN